MWPFGWWNRRRRQAWRSGALVGQGDSLDLADLEEVIERNPTKIYVNLLLLETAEDDVGELMLSSSSRLPTPRLDPDAETPAFESVVNRFKIMAGLDPVIYQQPKEGRIELIVHGEPVTVHVRFVDMSGDRSVHIRMEWLKKPKRDASQEEM